MSNPNSALYCNIYSMVFSRDGAVEIEKSMERVKGSEDYNLILERLREDIGID